MLIGCLFGLIQLTIKHALLRCLDHALRLIERMHTDSAGDKRKRRNRVNIKNIRREAGEVNVILTIGISLKASERTLIHIFA